MIQVALIFGRSITFSVTVTDISIFSETPTTRACYNITVEMISRQYYGVNPGGRRVSACPKLKLSMTGLQTTWWRSGRISDNPIEQNRRLWRPLQVRTIDRSEGGNVFCISKLVAAVTALFKTTNYSVSNNSNYSLIFRQYYSLDITYFKSALDKRLLESLWNKYWVSTLSSSSLITVSSRFL